MITAVPKPTSFTVADLSPDHRPASPASRAMQAIIPSRLFWSLLVGAVGFLFPCTDSTQAADLTWSQPFGSYWELPGPWGGTRPTINDTVTIINPGNGSANELIVASPGGFDPTYTGTGFSNALMMNSAHAQTVNLSVYTRLLTFGGASINNRANASVGFGTTITGTWNVVGDINLTGNASTLTVRNDSIVTSIEGAVGTGAGANSYASAVTGGQWYVDDNLVVGANAGTGILEVNSGGLISVDGVITVAGGSAGSVGAINILSTSGTQGVLHAGSIVKSVGSGTLIFDGGILRAKRSEANFVTGFASGGLGIANNGAYIDSNGFNVGISSGFVGQGGLAKLGSGTLTLSGSNSYGGNTAIRSGGIAVSGGVINSPSGTLAIGAGSGENGTLSINSGGRVTAAQSFVGANGVGSVAVTSGTLNVAGSMSVGSTGTGSFTVNGGVASNGNAFFGSSTGTGSATVSSGTWTNTADLLMGRASLAISGGAVNTANNSILGAYASTASVANVTGGSWDSSNFLIVGFAGSGSVHVNGGYVAGRNGVIIGYDTPGTGTLTLSSGTLATVWVAELNAGTGKLNLNGGTVRALATYGDFLSGFEAGDVTLGGTRTNFDTNGNNVGINAVLSGTGGLNKVGAGTLTLSGSQAFTDGVNVDGGTLLVTGDASSGALFFVDANATLGGTGVLDDVRITDLGTLTPGTITGTGLLTIEGDLTMDADSTLSLQFSGTGAFDQLAVGGLFNATDATLYLGVGYAAQAGDSFQVFTGARPVPGAFTIVSDLGGGLFWDASLLSSAGTLSIVPEPASVSLAALGLATLVFRRRIRRRRL